MSPLNVEETKVLLHVADVMGFPGMLKSIDCCKWRWRTCPTVYRWQYKGKEKVLTVTMTAIVDDPHYIWHAFFGIAGCNNDLTMMDASSLISMIAGAIYSVPCDFSRWGFNKQAVLVGDEIYSKCPCFLHSIHNL